MSSTLVPLAGDDALLHVRVNRRTAIAVGLSLLIHALVLFVSYHPSMQSGSNRNALRGPLVVRLVPPDAPSTTAPSQDSANSEAVPEAKPRQRAQPRQKARRNGIITLTRPSGKRERSDPQVPSSASRESPPDLAAVVEAARSRRGESTGSTAQDRPTSPEIAANEVAMERIRRNVQAPGTNGVFEILSLSTRYAKFSFRGWATGSSNSRKEIIEVDAGLNGNVELAVIRRMIELIRTYYKGDFNWISQRLDRTVVLSARMQDNAALEDFMMKEFAKEFSRNGR